MTVRVREDFSWAGCSPLLVAIAILSTFATTVATAQESTSDASEAKQPQFNVWEIRVLGNTVLPAKTIEQAMYPFLGENRSFATIEDARVVLEKTFRDAGYATVFVDIPEQDVGDDGVVRLQVTEGRLDRVRIVGARYFSNGRIREVLPVLQKDSILNLTVFQRQLNGANRDSRDRQLTPVLRAGKEQGTVDMDIRVQDHLPLHGSVEVNDQYTANTSRTRANATVSYDNLFQRYHSLSFQFQTAPEATAEARVLAATYVAPIQRYDDIVAVYAVDTDSEFTTLGADFASLGVIGKGRIYGARYIATLPEAEGFYPSLSFGADYKRFKEVIVLEDGTPAETPISYLNWSIAYSATARSEKMLSSVDATLNFGIRGIGNSAEEFRFKRYSGTPNKGEPNYFYLRVAAKHERPLFGNFVFSGRVAGQYTPHALISNEQFSIGGVETVRGYLESERLGDMGAFAQLELHSPAFLKFFSEATQLYALAFVDAGVIGIQEALPDNEGNTISRYDLGSAGAGLRLSGSKGVTASLDWAYPFVATDNVPRGDSRVHFQLRFGF